MRCRLSTHSSSFPASPWAIAPHHANTLPSALQSCHNPAGCLGWAGVYVLGVAGSDECPANFVRITDEMACSLAADTFGLLLSRRATSRIAFGCFTTGDSPSSPVVFNTDRRGVASNSTRLLCAMAVTPAPICPGCTAAPAGPPAPCSIVHASTLWICEQCLPALLRFLGVPRAVI
jgi:hypothetical protein